MKTPEHPTVTIPPPHVKWGSPTRTQLKYLEEYVSAAGPMSIYGDSGIYRQLEDALSKYYGLPYCVLTNTGTSALSSAYFGLGISPGDEVIVPTYTFLATVTPLLRLGAKIVFCDADSNTGNISPVDLERRISQRTKVVAITHMWGVPCDMARIEPVVRAAGARLLEDCSHSHFTRYRGKLLGTFGDVACLSIGALKTLTCGEGGFLLTADPDVYIRATLLGHFAQRSEEAISRMRSEGFAELVREYSGKVIGFGENYRMHPYAAVMAHAMLDSGEIFRVIENRAQSLKYFASVLELLDGIDPPMVDEDYYSGGMYGFKAKIYADGEALATIIDEMRSRNVKIKLPDTGLLHTEPLFVDVIRNYNETFSGGGRYLRGRVSLPTFSEGLPGDRGVIDQYAEVIGYVLKKHQVGFRLSTTDF